MHRDSPTRFQTLAVRSLRVPTLHQPLEGTRRPHPGNLFLRSSRRESASNLLLGFAGSQLHLQPIMLRAEGQATLWNFDPNLTIPFSGIRCLPQVYCFRFTPATSRDHHWRPPSGRSCNWTVRSAGIAPGWRSPPAGRFDPTGCFPE